MKNVISKLMMVAGFITLAAACSEPDPVPEQVPVQNDVKDFCVGGVEEVVVDFNVLPSTSMPKVLGEFSFTDGFAENTSDVVALKGCIEKEFVPNREVDVDVGFSIATTYGGDYIGSLMNTLAPLGDKVRFGNCRLSAGDVTLVAGVFHGNITLTTDDKTVGKNCEGLTTDVIFDIQTASGARPQVVVARESYPVFVTLPTYNGVPKASALEYNACYVVNVNPDFEEEDEFLVSGEVDEDTGLTNWVVVQGYTVSANLQQPFGDKDLVLLPNGQAGYRFCISATGSLEFNPDLPVALPDGTEQVMTKVKSYGDQADVWATCNFESSLPYDMDDVLMSEYNPHYYVYTWPDVSVPADYSCTVSDGTVNLDPNEVIFEVNGYQVRSAVQPIEFSLDPYGIPVLENDTYLCVFTPYDRVRVSGNVTLVYSNLGDANYVTMWAVADGDGSYQAELYLPPSKLEMDVMWGGGYYDALSLEGPQPTLNTLAPVVQLGTLSCEGVEILSQTQFAHDAKWTVDLHDGTASQWSPGLGGGIYFQ